MDEQEKQFLTTSNSPRNFAYLTLLTLESFCRKLLSKSINFRQRRTARARKVSREISTSDGEFPKKLSSVNGSSEMCVVETWKSRGLVKVAACRRLELVACMMPAAVPRRAVGLVPASPSAEPASSSPTSATTHSVRPVVDGRFRPRRVHDLLYGLCRCEKCGWNRRSRFGGQTDRQTYRHDHCNTSYSALWREKNKIRMFVVSLNDVQITCLVNT